MNKILLFLLIMPGIAQCSINQRPVRHAHSIERKNQTAAQNTRQIMARDNRKPLFRGGEIPRARQTRGQISQGR